MDVKITLFDKGLMATFNVEQENATTFAIRLKNYDGEPKPPLYLKLHRTSSGWTSAFKDALLISEIGMAIDSKIRTS